MVAQTLAIYDRDARLFLMGWGKKRYKRPALLVEWLGLVPTGAVLLDLGCGAGQDARYLQGLGYRVAGLDHTRPLLSFGRTGTPSLPLLLGDMRRLPIRHGSLDGVWAAASLMHLPKAAVTGVLTRLRRSVRRGGTLAATVTYGTRSGVLTRGWMPGRFFARWRKGEFAHAIRRAGWEVEVLRVVNNQERKGRWIHLIARRA